MCFFFFQAEDGIRDDLVTGVQTCALPICTIPGPTSRTSSSVCPRSSSATSRSCCRTTRSEEHTSELQSPDHLVCRLLLEKKNTTHCRSIFRAIPILKPSYRIVAISSLNLI